MIAFVHILAEAHNTLDYNRKYTMFMLVETPGGYVQLMLFTAEQLLNNFDIHILDNWHHIRIFCSGYFLHINAG